MKNINKISYEAIMTAGIGLLAAFSIASSLMGGGSYSDINERLFQDTPAPIVEQTEPQPRP